MLRRQFCRQSAGKAMSGTELLETSKILCEKRLVAAGRSGNRMEKKR